MTSFITLLVVMVAVAIIIIVLLQRSKSGGGLGAVAGGQTEAMFGANATTVLAKATTWLIITFFALTIILTMVNNGSKDAESRLTAEDNEAIPTQAATVADQVTTEVEKAKEQVKAAVEKVDVPVKAVVPTTEKTK